MRLLLHLSDKFKVVNQSDSDKDFGVFCVCNGYGQGDMDKEIFLGSEGITGKGTVCNGNRIIGSEVVNQLI